jgi:D-glycero-alpha-D-manno-heptose-7-phosphate kinase
VAFHAFEATAPTRVDLAGGTLDIWPLYLFHAGARTVNVAIDRRARCRVETGVEGIRIESRDTRARVEGRDVAQVLAAGELPLVASILDALEIVSGMSVVTESRVPAGSGLGGSSALAVAVAGAASAAAGRPLHGEALVALVRDAEARTIGVPTGVQDYWAAVHAGVLKVALRPGGPRAARLATDPGKLEECLILVDAGATRFSGVNNWEVFKARIAGEAAVIESLDAIAGVARRLEEALVGGRYAEVTGLIAEEWQARKRLGPGVSSPELDQIVEAAASAGGAAKACGAGGGGIAAAWAPPGRREAVAAALADAGFPPLAFRVDLRGLEVNRL